MEKAKDKRDEMISELLQGMEFAKQFRSQILNPTYNNHDDDHASSYNIDHQAFKFSLLEKMLSSFDKTITIAKLLNVGVPQHPYKSSLEFPSSLVINSPRSENSCPDFPASKRRKMLPRWTKRVEVTHLNDGYTWRKYGQKEILGSKFPRSYYRCTYRNTKGCAAKKQVQQLDEDPSIYQVIYGGEHTCTQGPNQAQGQINPVPVQITTDPPPPPSPEQEVCVGFDPQGEVKVEPDHYPEDMAQIFGSFSFNSAQLQPEPTDNYILSCSPAFGSPATSESNYLPASSYWVTGNAVGPIVQSSESDINDRISAPNSVTNSPIMGDFEFSLDQLLDIDPNFPFEF